MRGVIKSLLRPAVWCALAICLMASIVYARPTPTTSAAQEFSASSAGGKLTHVATQVHAATPKTAQPTAVASVITAKTVVATPQTASPQACVKATAPSLGYLPISVDSTPGLTQVTDPANYYQVYGNTAAQIRAQVQQCSSVATDDGDDFTADTQYAINWQANYIQTADGSCQVAHASVGLHIGFVYPHWNATASAAASLPASWQTFISNLTTHENGHAALDSQYANTILSSIQNLPAMSCSGITDAVNAVAQQGITVLNQANDAYDAATNHGATQGAILP